MSGTKNIPTIDIRDQNATLGGASKRIKNEPPVHKMAESKKNINALIVESFFAPRQDASKNTLHKSANNGAIQKRL